MCWITSSRWRTTHHAATATTATASKAAAKKLKYTGYGLAHVKVELLGKKPPGQLAQY